MRKNKLVGYKINLAQLDIDEEKVKIALENFRITTEAILPAVESYDFHIDRKYFTDKSDLLDIKIKVKHEGLDEIVKLLFHLLDSLKFKSSDIISYSCYMIEE